MAIPKTGVLAQELDSWSLEDLERHLNGGRVINVLDTGNVNAERSAKLRELVRLRDEKGCSQAVDAHELEKKLRDWGDKSPNSRFSPTPCPTSEEQAEGERSAAIHYRNTLIEMGGKPTRAIRENPIWETKWVDGVLYYRNPDNDLGWENVGKEFDSHHQDHWYAEKRQFSDELELWKNFRDYQQRARASQFHTLARDRKQRYFENYQRRVRDYWQRSGRMDEVELLQDEQQQTKLITWMEYEAYQHALIGQHKKRMEQLREAVQIEKERLEKKYQQPIESIWHKLSKKARERSEGCPELSHYSHAKRELHYGPHLEVERAETRLKWIQQQIPCLVAECSDRRNETSAFDLKERENMHSSLAPKLPTQCRLRSTRCGSLWSYKVSKPATQQPRRSQRQLTKKLVNGAVIKFQEPSMPHTNNRPHQRVYKPERLRARQGFARCHPKDCSSSFYLVGPISSRLRKIGDLLSINYLWEGDKYWIAVPQSHAVSLEQKSKDTNNAFYTSNCAQTLQHSATWYPISTLEEWEIPYTVIHQRAREVVITFSQVYHQGFSAGYTFAEAVNYADADWNIQGYRGCSARTCPPGSVGKDMLESREAGDERSPDESADHAIEWSDRGQPEVSPTISRTRSTIKKANTPRNRSVPISSPASAVEDRKRKSSISKETPQKMVKLGSIQQSDLTLIKGLSVIPKELKQPKEVYQIFSSRCKDESHDTISLLTRLFFAVASPAAFYQLRDACTASRPDEVHGVPRPTIDVLQTLQALDQLDVHVSTALILRCYHLTYLAACRHKKEEHIQSGRRRVPRRLKYGVSMTQTQRVATGNGNDSSSALAAMMKEAYPSLVKKTDEYQKKYHSLIHRVHRGKNWYRLQQQLSPGILALVPTGGELDIQNFEIEKLTESSFESFLDVLVEFRGSFLREVGELVSLHTPKT